MVFDPIQEVILITLILSVVMAILYRLLTKPGEVRKLKADMSHYKEEMSKAQKAGDREKASKFMSEQMNANKKLLSLTMRPNIFSFGIFIIALGWLASTYAELVVLLPILLPVLSWEFPFITLTMTYNWFWLYLIVILPSSMFFRKMLGVD